jgi:hypothetical protein
VAIAVVFCLGYHPFCNNQNPHLEEAQGNHLLLQLSQ